MPSDCEQILVFCFWVSLWIFFIENTTINHLRKTIGSLSQLLWIQISQMICNGIESKFETSGTRWRRFMKYRKKKIEATRAPSLDWPWFEHLNDIFSNSTKINGVFNVTNKGVHMMHLDIEVVKVSDEKDVICEAPHMLSNPMRQTSN